MKLELEIYSCLCATKIFKINNIVADTNDFGEQYDNMPEKGETYGCGDMKFKAKKFTKEVLNKYKINKDEYNNIAGKLECKLSFGCCGWCI